jgi:hypothetical protein
MGEDVVIFCSVRNLSDLKRTLDVRVVMEDGQGVLIDQTLMRDVRCAPGEDKGIDGLAFKLVATNAGPHRVRLLLHEDRGETDLAAAGFMVEDVPATGVPAHGVSGADGQEQTAGGDAGSLSAESTGDEHGRAEGVDGPAPEGLPVVGLDGLEGTISAQPSPIFQGLSETIYYTVTKADGSDLTGLSVNVVIADHETGKARQSFSAPRAHFKGSSFAGSFTFSTGALEPGEYLVKLAVSSGSGSEAQEMATTSFVIRRIDTVVT